MAKRQVKNLDINMDKVDEIINEEVNRRVKEKIVNGAKRVVAGFAIAGTLIGAPIVGKEIIKREENYLESKEQQEQAYLEGERTTISDEEAYINGYDNDNFEVKGENYTGTYKTR